VIGANEFSAFQNQRSPVAEIGASERSALDELGQVAGGMLFVKERREPLVRIEWKEASLF
jgi:hypothetical protein